MSTKETQAADSKELATAKPSGLPVAAFDFGDSVGAGMEGATVESFAIPFLAVAQSNSPQCDEADAKYISGCKTGMMFNSVNGRLYDGKKGVQFLPVSYQRRFIHWGPRGTPDAGFKGEYLAEEAEAMIASGKVVEQDGKLFFPLADGTIDDKKCAKLVDTRNHFGILLDEETGNYGNILLSLSSTQIKKSKQLMSMLSEVKVELGGKKVTPPTWYNVVRIVTVPESNDKGKWHGVRAMLEGFIDSQELFLAGKAFHEALQAGTAGTVQYAEPEDMDTGASAGAGNQF